MPPIPFEIGKVVHEVNRTRQHAERDESAAGQTERWDMVQPLGEDQSGEYD
jgi:hypothetical protein